MSTADLERRQRRVDAIVSAALDIVGEGGLDALTMRRIGDRLGFQLPTIYRLFDSKQVLLDHMAEAILGGALETPLDESDWETKTKDLASGLRRAILAQRDGARIVGGSYAARQNTMAFADRLIGTMEEAGFQGALALWSTTTIFCYVLGETLEQQGSSGGAVAALREIEAKDAFPHLFATPVAELVNFDERFAYGLGVIIGGLRTELAARNGRD